MARQVATHRKPTVVLEPRTDKRLRAYAKKARCWRHSFVDAVLCWFLRQEPMVQAAITSGDDSGPDSIAAMLPELYSTKGTTFMEYIALTIDTVAGEALDDARRELVQRALAAEAPPLRIGNMLFRLVPDKPAPPEFTDAEQDYLAELGRQIDAEYDTDAEPGTDAEHDVDTEDGEQTP